MNAGENRIVRQSTESEITIPFEQTFRDLSIQREDPKRTDLAAFNFCGCGWPQHMLVPKGTEAGTPYVLFVMLSNYEFDAVSGFLTWIFYLVWTIALSDNTAEIVNCKVFILKVN